MTDRDRRALAGIRREPPPFRRLAVRSVFARSPRMLRITLAGEELAGFEVKDPAASVRLLVPSDGGADLAIPTWNGNEFLLEDGSRPVIRTFTPLNLDPAEGTIDLDIVRHPGGAISEWAERAGTDAPAALSGPGRGYAIDAGATSYLLAGDETALPAIGQLIDAIPDAIPVHAIVEIVRPDARLDLPPHAALTAEWVELMPDAPPGAALARAVASTEIPSGARVWAAGEAAAMHRIRRHLFDERALARSDTTIRGYWKRRS